MNPVLDEIAKTSIQLMLKEPFYGHFFTSVLKDVTEKTDSVAIALTGKQMLRLIVNEDYWKEELKGLSDEATKSLRYGAIKHQILHIVFKHILRMGEFGNKQLYGIAADLATNQYINSNELTEDAIRREDFPEFKLEKGQGIDYYYRRLSEELDNMSTASLGGENEEDNDTEEEDNHTESDGGQSDEEQNPNLNKAQQKLKELLESEDHKQLDQHKFWEEMEKMSSAERKMMETLINDSIVNSVNRIKSKNAGDLPAGLQQYIDLLIESLKPNVNWRRVLRIFTASSSRTRLKNTIRRPSKRYGTTPGIKIQRKQKLLVAIDTSGSVNDEELREFFGELYHIWKQGAEIYVVECDVQIHNQYFYNGRPPSVVSGRGGTDFNAPLEYANEVYLPDAIVYFTDGYAAAPEAISRKPILWMITSQGIGEEDWEFLPGRKVKMIKQLAF